MNFHNALAFGAIGLVMKMAPFVFSTSLSEGFGQSTRGLWLAFMSLVMLSVAGAWFARKAYVEAKARWVWASAAIATRRAQAGAQSAAASRARISI